MMRTMVAVAVLLVLSDQRDLAWADQCGFASCDTCGKWKTTAFVNMANQSKDSEVYINACAPCYLLPSRLCPEKLLHTRYCTRHFENEVQQSVHGVFRSVVYKAFPNAILSLAEGRGRRPKQGR